MGDRQSMSVQRALFLAGIIVVAVGSGLLGYLAWTSRDWFWGFAWFLPLGIALAGSFAVEGFFKGKARIEGFRRRLASSLLVLAAASVLSGWLYIPVLWRQAENESRNKAWGPVHAIMVPGQVRVFHRLVSAAGAVWLLAAFEAFIAFGIRPSWTAASLIVIGSTHTVACTLYSVWPLDYPPVVGRENAGIVLPPPSPTRVAIRSTIKIDLPACLCGLISTKRWTSRAFRDGSKTSANELTSPNRNRRESMTCDSQCRHRA